jgi:hypothetical protein
LKLYYYVHTGHRIGLDRFRRAATIIRALGDIDITLLTSDYRIASECRNFGIKRSIGVDVVRGIPLVAERGDKLIFDSAEHNPLLLDDMTKYFSTFIRISDDPDDTKHPDEFLINPYLQGEGICNGVAVDESYFGEFEKSIERAFFFGDDDYEEDLLKNTGMFEGFDFDLMLGFYYFFDYEDKLAPAFKRMYEFEEYDDVVKHAKVLVSASPQAVLENLAAGGKPVFLQRPDYPRGSIPLFESLNIPIVDGFDRKSLMEIIGKINSYSYEKSPHATHELKSFIKTILI